MAARRIAPFAVALSALFVAAQHVDAQDRVRVNGVVVDGTTGEPIPHATVEAIDHGRTVTDQHGRFRLERIPVGTVTVQVSQLGYAQWTGRHEVVADGGELRVPLSPDPIQMRAIEVVNDRLKARRNAIPYSVRAYEVDDMAASAAWDGFDLVRSRVSVQPCTPDLHGSWCVRSRGRLVHPRVTVDDAPLFGGFDALLGWPTEDLYLIEVIRGGQHVRVYTKRFAALLASGRTRLHPVIW